MVVIHFTAKLREKLHLAEVTEEPVAAGAHLRWYAHLFRMDGVQYILTTNAASLYSVVMFGRGVTDSDLYLRQFLASLRDQLEAADMQMIYKRCIAPHTGTVTLARTEDRSVLGSMNDMVFHCKHRLERGDVSPWELGEWLNTTPYGAIGYQIPKQTFVQLPLQVDKTPVV
jgi:hypothetical protein